jgi:predicted signal transduction protein with EAL and GGDEF domain
LTITTWDGTVIQVSASIGVTVLTRAVRDVDEFLKNADIACYKAKQKGQNQVQVFIPNNVESQDNSAKWNHLSEFYENEFCMQSQ